MLTPRGMRGSEAAIVAVAVALSYGCGPTKFENAVPATADNPLATADNPKDNAPPKTNHKEDVIPVTEARLAEVERAILAKQAELAKLQAEADSLRGLLKAGKGQKRQDYRDPAIFFRDMPQEVYPKYGEQGGVERAACRKWLTDKFVPGQVVEWDVKVVSVADSGDGPYQVVVKLDVGKICVCGALGEGIEAGWLFGDPVSLGKTKCQVILTGYLLPNLLDNDETPAVVFEKCSEQDVKRLRSLKGKNVVASGKVKSVKLHGGPTWIVEKGDDSDPKKQEQVAVLLNVPNLTIDGFAPGVSKK